MYTKKELLKKLDEFLEDKSISERSKKDYKVDCVCYIKWYGTHKHLPEGQLYRAFLKALDNSDLSKKTIRRRKLIVGEYLVYIGIYSSSHLIVKNCNNMIRYYDITNSEIYLNGKKINFLE